MKKILLGFITAALLVGVLIACTSPGTDTTAPTVSSTVPLDAAVGVATNATVTATFSKAMDETTIIGANFTLAIGLTPVSGTVTYDATSKTATFAPAADMAVGTTYTATITTGVQDSAGISMAARKVWTFNTSTHAGPAAVDLKTAGNFVILAKSKVENTPTSAVTGDIGLSPAALTFITGFSGYAANVSNTYYISTEVTGKLYASNMIGPPATTGPMLTTAVADMETAYTDAAGRTKGVGSNLNLGAGTIPPSTTLAPGTYTWTTNLSIPTDLTISGGAEDTWLFQITGTLTTAGSIILQGGALPKNIVWQVSGATTLGAGKEFNGIILCKTAIKLNTTAVVNGRLLAQTAVTLTGTNTVTQP